MIERKFELKKLIFAICLVGVLASLSSVHVNQGAMDRLPPSAMSASSL